MNSVIGVLRVLVVSVALAACSNASMRDNRSGQISLDLEIPNGESVETINLALSCDGIDDPHVLNVIDGAVRASFGGLAVGPCSVTLWTQAPSGTDCRGRAEFLVEAGQNVSVPVSLRCQGVNASEDGTVVIRPRFAEHDCRADRISAIYAIPADVYRGGSTKIEVITSDAIVGTPSFSFGVRNTPRQTATGLTSPVTDCAPSSDACATFTCEDLGAATTTDPFTGLPMATAWVTVTVEDDHCFDTEEVFVLCLDRECGDGVVTAPEECDDGNNENGDGCNAACVQEFCGDGIVQPELGEFCDDEDGLCIDCRYPMVGCGDGVIGPDEECDGDMGIMPGQQCSMDCQIVASCGNGIVEGMEDCDDGPEGSATCTAACEATAQNNTACQECITVIPLVGPYDAEQCPSGTVCGTIKACALQSGCYARAPAECFCGVGSEAMRLCENDPNFVPTGACVDEIRVGAGQGALDNSTVLLRYFDADYPLGQAMLIVDQAFFNCRDVCF
jgi:cysteine-rich repeat protein